MWRESVWVDVCVPLSVYVRGELSVRMCTIHACRGPFMSYEHFVIYPCM